MFNLMQIISLMQSGGNPQQIIGQLMQQNPQMAQMLQGVNMNDTNAMQNLCRNLCVQKGLDFDTMVAKFRQNGGKL